MSMLDDVIGVISPGWKLNRLRAREAVKAFEAVVPSRTFKPRREGRNADQLSQMGAQSLREQARWLDNNHDIIIGCLDKLEERVIGRNGISVEPMPMTKTGEISQELAKEIRRKWGEWSVSPDVTGQYTRPMLERLMLRSWLRDGEVFAQMVSGSATGLTPPAGVPFWIEALEADFVPLANSIGTDKLVQGIYLNDWGRPKSYQVYKTLPANLMGGDIKEIDAENMLHLKFIRRLHQTRGTSILSGVLKRISALKDYEDYELIAARIAASLGMYIKKGDGQSYDGNANEREDREVEIEPGTIYDDLMPGEEIGLIKSDRPNPNLETFRNGQLRCVAAGIRLSFSSTARNYNGTYSAQRQELVESTDGYHVLQDCFVAMVTRPMYRQWLKMAIASGEIAVPGNVDPKSLYNATYTGPRMPWIDPAKESNAWRLQIRGGAATEADWARAAGRNPEEVKAQRKAEIDENKKMGLIFDTDPNNDRGVNTSG